MTLHSVLARFGDLGAWLLPGIYIFILVDGDNTGYLFTYFAFLVV